jgi:farnesyl-diphosphate farnesyltransferase
MAERMAFWADRNWLISNEKDLDTYTFAVAGAVGLILSEIWGWYENVHTDRSLAIAYGRGLQSVNILRNSAEDLTRGVSFYPPGWTQ